MDGAFFIACGKGGICIKTVTHKIEGYMMRYNRQAIRLMICIACLLCISVNVYATSAGSGGPDMWSKAKEIMQSVYNQICIISTIAGVVAAAVALLLMNFSKSSRTVDESRTWLKRIIISWVLINSLGFIVAYIAPLLQGGTTIPSTTT